MERPCTDSIQSSLAFGVADHTEQTVMSMLLATNSLTAADNLCVSEEGKTDVKYVQLFTEQYPFVFTSADGYISVLRMRTTMYQSERSRRRTSENSGK